MHQNCIADSKRVVFFPSVTVTIAVKSVPISFQIIDGSGLVPGSLFQVQILGPVDQINKYTFIFIKKS